MFLLSFSLTALTRRRTFTSYLRRRYIVLWFFEIYHVVVFRFPWLFLPSPFCKKGKLPLSIPITVSQVISPLSVRARAHTLYFVERVVGSFGIELPTTPYLLLGRHLLYIKTLHCLLYAFFVLFFSFNLKKINIFFRF